jgi:hypothetical protein
MVLPIKGGSLCVKDVFAKKILVPGADSAGGAGAAASDANDWTPQRRLSFFLWLS